MTQPELNSTKIDKRVLGASMQTTVYFKLDGENKAGSFSDFYSTGRWNKNIFKHIVKKLSMRSQFMLIHWLIVKAK